MAGGGGSTSGVDVHEWGFGRWRCPAGIVGRISGSGPETDEDADVSDVIDEVAPGADPYIDPENLGTDGSRLRITPHGVGIKPAIRHGRATMVFAPEGE